MLTKYSFTKSYIFLRFFFKMDCGIDPFLVLHLTNFKHNTMRKTSASFNKVKIDIARN